MEPMKISIFIASFAVVFVLLTRELENSDFDETLHTCRRGGINK